MAKVLMFNGSPRKKGAISQVMEEVKKGLEKAGNETIMYYLNCLTYRGCQGCLACKKTEICCLKDDLMPMYQELREAEGIVFGTPIYMYGISGQTKTWMDRLYPIIDLEHNALYGEKKLMSIYSQAHPDGNAYIGEMERVKCALNISGIHETIRFVVSSMNPACRIAQVNPEDLMAAYEAGKKFMK